MAGARILDMMQHEGIIGPPNGSKPREVLKSRTGWRKWRTSCGDNVRQPILAAAGSAQAGTNAGCRQNCLPHTALE